MSKARASLSDVVGELEREASDAEDQATRDACRILAAQARGERIPQDAARRVRQRAEEGDD